MGFILYDKVTGGYYGGQNKKYWDMFNLTVRDCAKVLDIEEDALKIRESLNKGDYNFVVYTI